MAKHTVFARELENETGRTWFKIKISDDFSFDVLKGRTVEALMHVRNGFDQAANIAASYISGKKFKGNYPWSDSASDFETRVAKFPVELRNSFKTQEPYPRGSGYSGGNDLIRALARLCNNKHSIGFVVEPGYGISDLAQIKLSKDCEEFGLYSSTWDAAEREVAIFFIKGGGVNFGENAKFGLRVGLEIPGFPNPPEVTSGLAEFLSAGKSNLEIMNVACRS